MQTNQRIKEIREKHSLSQEDFAKKLGASPQTISKWEEAKTLPNIENLIHMNREFSASIDEFIKGDPRLGEKIIADSAIKHWHWLRILFLTTLIIYIISFGFTTRIWQVGLGIATTSLLWIELWLMFRRKMIR